MGQRLTLSVGSARGRGNTGTKTVLTTASTPPLRTDATATKPTGRRVRPPIVIQTPSHGSNSSVGAPLKLRRWQKKFGRAQEWVLSPGAIIRSGRMATLVTRQPVPADETRQVIEAELKRVRALPAEEREALGSEFTDPEAIFACLEEADGRATVLLRASWVRSLRRGQLLPKRGSPLPPGATIDAAELRKIYKEAHGRSGQRQVAIPLIAVSHYWRTKDQPDPHGETLAILKTALDQRWDEFTRCGVSDLGIFFDFSSLFQHPRTEEQARIFGKSLKGINLWYDAHQHTMAHASAHHGLPAHDGACKCSPRRHIFPTGMLTSTRQCSSCPQARLRRPSWRRRRPLARSPSAGVRSRGAANPRLLVPRRRVASSSAITIRAGAPSSTSSSLHLVAPGCT